MKGRNIERPSKQAGTLNVEGGARGTREGGGHVYQLGLAWSAIFWLTASRDYALVLQCKVGECQNCEGRQVSCVSEGRG